MGGYRMHIDTSTPFNHCRISCACLWTKGCIPIESYLPTKCILVLSYKYIYMPWTAHLMPIYTIMQCTFVRYVTQPLIWCKFVSSIWVAACADCGGRWQQWCSAVADSRILRSLWGQNGWGPRRKEFPLASGWQCHVLVWQWINQAENEQVQSWHIREVMCAYWQLLVCILCTGICSGLWFVLWYVLVCIRVV